MLPTSKSFHLSICNTMSQKIKQYFKMIFLIKYVHERFVSLTFNLESFYINPSVKKKQEKFYNWYNDEWTSDRRDWKNECLWIKHMGIHFCHKSYICKIELLVLYIKVLHLFSFFLLSNFCSVKVLIFMKQNVYIFPLYFLVSLLQNLYLPKIFFCVFWWKLHNFSFSI